MRLFVAVWPPPEVVSVLAAIERRPVEGVRWTSPAQWHVTLRFLGEVPGESFDDVSAWFRSATAGLSPVTASLGDMTARFGRGVLHVPVEGLASWAAAVAGAVPGVDVRAEERPGPFVGHLTLARSRGRRGGSVVPLAGSPLPPGPRTWIASELALVRSRLAAGGSEYTDVATAHVGGTA